MRPAAMRIAFLGAATLCAHSATLSGVNQSANPGDSVSLSVSLSSGGQSLSGLQFDLTWDAALEVHVVTGAQIGIATKMLYTAQPQPRVLRCLVAGMNGNILADGEVIRLYINVISGAGPGTVQLNIIDLNATGPDGTPVFLAGGAINVQVLNGTSTQPFQPGGVLNSASLAAGPVAPGEIVTLLGSVSVAAPVVLFNNTPAPVLYAGSNQINTIVPFGLDLSNPVQVQVQQGGSNSTASVPVAAASPAIFTLSTTGAGPGAILNQNYSVNAPANAAPQGTVIMVYGTGFGALNPLPTDGLIEQTLATTPMSVTATIDGIPADVIYAGAAPGLIAGVEQINVRVPAGVKANPAAPILLTIGSFTTQPGVTVSVQ
jgi:uncharacterized protein (TIGR03437 family)